jgi:hypothetical protein
MIPRRLEALFHFKRVKGITFVRRTEVIYLRKELLVLHISQLYRIIMVFSDHLNVFMNRLETLLLLLKRRFNLQDKVREDFVAPLMEKLLQ